MGRRLVVETSELGEVLRLLILRLAHTQGPRGCWHQGSAVQGIVLALFRHAWRSVLWDLCFAEVKVRVCESAVEDLRTGLEFGAAGIFGQVLLYELGVLLSLGR